MCGQTFVSRVEEVQLIKVALGVSQYEFQQIWSDVFNSPTVPTSTEKKNVGILVFDDVEAQDLAGIFEVMAATRMADGSAQFDVFTVAKDTNSIRTTAGTPVAKHMESSIEIVPSYTFENHPSIDILFVVGGQAIDDIIASEKKTPLYTPWIKEISKSAQYVAGACSGVMLLAQTGLLQNMRVTTHHTRFHQLKNLSDRNNYNLSVLDTRNGVNFVHEPYSKFMTAGGVHCGIAVAIHIVELIQGLEASENLATDVLEYTIPRGLNCVPKVFPQPVHMDPQQFVLGFSHINVIVADLKMMDEATEFYKRVLGFEEAWSLWLPPATNQHFAKDAGFKDCKVLVRFLYHPNAQFHLELMMYEFPKGEQSIAYHKTNDVGGIRHIALEVNDAVAAYNWLKDQEGVTLIKPVREGYGPPQRLTPDPQTFFYWLDPYGIQWEFEQGRPMARIINGIIG
jgi:purine nucleosidase